MRQPVLPRGNPIIRRDARMATFGLKFSKPSTVHDLSKNEAFGTKGLRKGQGSLSWCQFLDA